MQIIIANKGEIIEATNLLQKRYAEQWSEQLHLLPSASPHPLHKKRRGKKEQVQEVQYTVQENVSHYFKVGEGGHSVYQDWFDVVLEIRVVDVAEVEVAWLVLGRVVQAAQVCVGLFGAAEPYTWKKSVIFL